MLLCQLDRELHDGRHNVAVGCLERLHRLCPGHASLQTDAASKTMLSGTDVIHAVRPSAKALTASVIPHYQSQSRDFMLASWQGVRVLVPRHQLRHRNLRAGDDVRSMNVETQCAFVIRAHLGHDQLDVLGLDARLVDLAVVLLLLHDRRRRLRDIELGLGLGLQQGF